jgi:predicted DNA-binding transcriptional regulator AlpA
MKHPIIIESVISENLIKQNLPLNRSLLPEKALYKPTEVCKIFQVSKPTLYQWLKQKKLKSFKAKSRRYFLRTGIENLISRNPHSEIKKSNN